MFCPPFLSSGHSVWKEQLCCPTASEANVRTRSCPVLPCRPGKGCHRCSSGCLQGHHRPARGQSTNSCDSPSSPTPTLQWRERWTVPGHLGPARRRKEAATGGATGGRGRWARLCLQQKVTLDPSWPWAARLPQRLFQTQGEHGQLSVTKGNPARLGWHLFKSHSMPGTWVPSL